MTANTVITTLGLAQQARYTNQNVAGAWKWLAIGTGAATPTIADTALGAECTGTGMIRKLATLTYVADDISMWTATFTNSTGSTIVVTECGVFDQLAVGGTMLARGLLLAPKSVIAGQTITVRFSVKQAV